MEQTGPTINTTKISDFPDRFELVSPWPAAGDQPQAIDQLAEAFAGGAHDAKTLLGVTGSGKTFTMASVIARVQRPTLVMAHNKTLAAQLYSEFKEFFPHNAVHYFVSYYDYYQPEAYLPAQDIYIEKDASINERIEKLRLQTTKALLERRDVVVVASVSCIYGLGKRKNYEEAIFRFAVGEKWDRRRFSMNLIENYYTRNDMDLSPGNFRVRGDMLEIFPSYSDTALRVAFWGDEIERIDEIDPTSGLSTLKRHGAAIFPAKHYVTSKDAITEALGKIEAELDTQLAKFQAEGKLLEAERLKSRTRYDMEMLAEVGYCSGIENYSRFLDGREPGEPPGTLMDFFPDDFLLFIDESHMTVPQIRGMYNGDRARKEMLVEYGFRLPSCLDNRPLQWPEFSEFMRSVLFISATPADYELEHSSGVVEQLVRPTGVLDPEVEVRPAKDQISDLLGELKPVTDRGERVLITTLTKRSAEDLAEYLAELGHKVRYIHSELDAFERAELLRDLRLGVYSILVGVNLLREGIDLPEVSLVAILEADREGYLRSNRSLVQMIGRAARNQAGKVILYADRITDSIASAMKETSRRRAVQEQYNLEHGITPRTIEKAVRDLLPAELLANDDDDVSRGGSGKSPGRPVRASRRVLEKKMWEAVERLDFEEAAELRDRIRELDEGARIDVSGNADGKHAQNAQKYRKPHHKRRSSAQPKEHFGRSAEK